MARGKKKLTIQYIMFHDTKTIASPLHVFNVIVMMI